MTIDRLRALVSEDFDAVNHLIIDRIQSDVHLIKELSQHIIDSGGKRLRPLLVLLTCKACGYTGTDHITLAAMIEFFHTATLLHDDVVDESALRRGRTTANNIWGSKASVLVGDYLLTQSMKLMAQVNSLAVFELMADTSHQISCGEIKQLSNRHKLDVSSHDYFDVIRSKTALLFAAASCIGAIINKDIAANIKDNLYAYGLHVGNAFQLIDDMMDYCSDAETMGKNVGDDLADGKLTLPLIHALKHGTATQKEQIKNSIQQGSLKYLPEILIAVEETKAIAHTRAAAIQEMEAAISALAELPDSIYKSALVDLAQFAVHRSY